MLVASYPKPGLHVNDVGVQTEFTGQLIHAVNGDVFGRYLPVGQVTHMVLFVTDSVPIEQDKHEDDPVTFLYVSVGHREHVLLLAMN